jgi:hypothetical protein
MCNCLIGVAFTGQGLPESKRYVQVSCGNSHCCVLDVEGACSRFRSLFVNIFSAQDWYIAGDGKWPWICLLPK